MLLNVLENYNDTRGLVLYDHLKKIETLFFEEGSFVEKSDIEHSYEALNERC